jgi:hypothetical protein
MAKLKTDAIKASDIAEFLERSSDFSFEMAVLHELTALGFSCTHGGTYRDPITGKNREFDIRAKIIKAPSYNLTLAVECKNLRPNFPLLISCVQRQKSEAIHQVIISEKTPLYRQK